MRIVVAVCTLRYMQSFFTSLHLPPCGGFNGPYTCIDKLTKFVKLILVSIGKGALSAPEVACLFLEHIVRLLGISFVVLHNRGAYFTAHFWRCL